MSAHRVKFGAIAVTAVIGLAALALILATRSGDDPTTAVPTEASPPPPVVVAASFVRAYGFFDAEQAIAYLARDADISEITGSVSAQGADGTLGDFRLLLSLLEAQGYKQRLQSCEELGSSAAGTTVRCGFDFHAIRSDQLEPGPFSGSYFDLTVRDGEIVQASTTWEIQKFSPQVWEPFARWVSADHPRDAAVMYDDVTQSGARLSEKSIRLWEQRSREYVEVKAGETVEIAESFMAARNAHDAETAISLLSGGAVTARLLYDNTIDPSMPVVSLNQDERALAFEAERLFKARYERVKCRPSGEAVVTCTYLLDTRLRQIEGYPPVEAQVRLGFRENRIKRLGFPWLSVGFPAALPTEGARFVRWVNRTHPEAGGPFERGKLFRTLGQEVTLILTPESIDLLARYLDQYEGATDG